MEKFAKRSIFGYSPRAVMERINSINQEFESICKKLEEESSSIDREVHLLKEKIRMAKEDLARFKKLEDEIAGILFVSHMETAKKVCHAVEKAQQMEKNKVALVMSYEKKHAKLKEMLRKLLDEMQSITNDWQ